MSSSSAASTGGLRERAAALSWYHTMDLGDGVVTEGMFDTRVTVPKVPLPASLAGKRCLDVGTWDGFWAFELERRGAEEVVAIDLVDQRRWDWPPYMTVGGATPGGVQILEEFKGPDAAFRLAAEAYGSSVERRDMSIYDLSPDRMGTFDFAFLGSLLLHLRDPIRALASFRSVCTGEVVVADTVDAIPSYLRPRTPAARLEGYERPWWWIPNRAGLVRMLESAGFEILDTSQVYFLPLGPAHERTPLWKLWRSVRSAREREEIITRLKGIPHVAVRARPIG